MPCIPAEQAREAAAQRRLQHSRRWVGGLLFSAVLLFIGSSLLLKPHPAIGYLQAFAEAATVDTLVDWFAVTALFRHPLSLNIPHTAILPRNQRRIADELGRFIETNFLPERPIALQVYRLHPAENQCRRLVRNQPRQKWLGSAAQKLSATLQAVLPQEAAHLATFLLTKYGNGKQIGTALSKILILLESQGLPKSLQIALIGQLRCWPHQPDTRILLRNDLRTWAHRIETTQPDTWEKLKAQLRRHLVGQIDSLVAQRYSTKPVTTLLPHSLHTLACSEHWHRKLTIAKRQLDTLLIWLPQHHTALPQQLRRLTSMPGSL